MAFDAFQEADFEVFRIPDFSGRMAAIKERIRPKLQALGTELAPRISKIVSNPIFPHVARHARRTVNPPSDTWVAFCTDKQGYKKYPHYKVAISENCVRFLFEVGPEFHDKRRWEVLWRKNAGRLLPKGQFGWFRNEHDEEPSGKLASLRSSEILEMGERLNKQRAGQIVLGKAVSKEVALHWDVQECHREALKTFESFRDLYTLSNQERQRREVFAHRKALA